MSKPGIFVKFLKTNSAQLLGEFHQMPPVGYEEERMKAQCFLGHHFDLGD